MAENQNESKGIIELAVSLLKFLTPNEDIQEIRADRKRLRLRRKELRIAEKTRKDIYKEFKKDGFTQKETDILKQLDDRLLARKMELI